VLSLTGRVKSKYLREMADGNEQRDAGKGKEQGKGAVPFLKSRWPLSAPLSNRPAL